MCDWVSLLSYQQINLVLEKEDKRIRQLDALKKQGRAAQLQHFKSIAHEVWRSAVGLGAITSWILLGLVLGGAIAHNVLSRSVLCDQPVCMWLRFDENKVLKE